jgi:hypothetical protein
MQRLAVFAPAVWLVFAGSLVSEVQGQTDFAKMEISSPDSNNCILMVKVVSENKKPLIASW